MLSNLLPGAIAAIYADTAARGVLTQADWMGLQAAQTQWLWLSEEERRCVKRLERWIKMGRLVLTDEPSVVL